MYNTYVVLIFKAPSSALMAPTTHGINPQSILGPQINWDLAHRRRELMETTGNSKIKYFLKPEIERIVDYAKGNRSKHFLINTLWHTGARISEALELTKKDFIFDEAGCFIKLITLKQKKELYRLVPVTDKRYIDEARMILGDLPKASHTKIWDITRMAFNQYLKPVAKELV